MEALRYPAPMLPRVIAAMLVVCAATLVGCGESVRIQGTADEVWTDTIQILKLQGVMPAVIEPGKVRPRIDRSCGEIDLLYTQSVYYGDGAAFIQVDVDEPAENLERRVRMWVDFPVGNHVVRYGRALDDDTTAQFVRNFHIALAKFREENAPRDPPPEPSELSETLEKGEQP